MFTPEDVEMIRTIPISRCGCDDKRISHYTKNMIYSVHSGYHVVMKMMKNGEYDCKRGRMSSSSSSIMGMWKKTWSLLVLNKIRFFIWKACRKALAVRHNLE